MLFRNFTPSKAIDSGDGAMSRQMEAAAESSPQADRDWSSAPLGELANHIEQTHHLYLHRQLPVLMELMARTLRAHQAAHGTMLRQLQDVLWTLRG